MKFLGLAAALSATPAWGQLPAFPGAEGFGAYAAGGRGGDVYTVTNLNASGAGSLANGLATVPAAGRTIVFAVSGYIPVPSSNLRLTASKVTIAGQTAPGDGIGLRNGTFRISGDDVIVRHLRLRHGKYGSGGDCLNLDSGCTRAMLDHLSMSFSTDENFSSFNSPPENLTLQWSLNGWGLESHSCGGLWDQNHATCHHTLWAHNHTRNPKARPNGLLEWINNVTFDWDIGFIMGDSETPASWKANVIGNYFLCPPGNLRTRALEKANLDRNGVPNFSIFLQNNLHDADGDGVLNGTDKGYGIASGSYTTLTSAAPDTGSLPVTREPALLAFKKVASQSGPLRMDAAHPGPIRDEVDSRMAQNLLTQTANHITRESDLAGVGGAGFGVLSGTPAPVDSDGDGMPDFYELSLGWNPAAQDHNTVLASNGFFPAGTAAGYTRLEEYLHFLTLPHAVVIKNTTGNAPMDLARYTAGFAQSPVFTVAGVTGGTLTQSGVGGGMVTFTPTANFTGRAGFTFTVTDAAGSSWTQPFAILVTATGQPSNLVWQGDGAANTWDTATANWRKSGSPVAFDPGDRVSFTDAGSRVPAVAVAAPVLPGTVEVNAARTYQWAGAGSVSASGTLTKRGAGDLNLSLPVAAAGGVVLEAGSVTLTGNSGLTGGPMLLGDGTRLLNRQAEGNQPGIANALVVPAGATTELLTGNRIALTGAVTGTGILRTVVETTVSRVDFKGPMAAFGGTWNLSGAGGVRLFFNGGTFNGLDAASLELDGAVSLQPTTNSGGNTLNIGALSGTNAAAQLAGGTAGAVTYGVGALNRDTVFAGGFAGNAKLTKTGSGKLTLTGNSTHTGATAVNAGTLLVSGSMGNSAVNVAPGARLAGTGSLSGPVTVQAGARLQPGMQTGLVGTLTLGGGLSLGGATLPFDLSGSPASGNDRIVMTGGTLALTGTQTFQFNLTEQTLGAGTYPLISGATGSTASSVTLASNLPSGTRQTLSLERSAAGANPSYIQLVVGGSAASLVWTGAVNNQWDAASSNWTGATPNVFFPFDAVTFDQTSTVGNVTLPANVAPRAMTVVGANSYTWSGSGAIGGTGSLTKTGAGILTINPASVSTTATLTSGGAAVTVASATGLVPGMEILDGNFPAGTVIQSVVGNTVTMSAAATATTSVTATWRTRHSFSGGTKIGPGGGVVLASGTANVSGLGTGPVTFEGGSLTLAGHTGSNGTYWGDFPNALIVPAGQTGVLKAPQRGSLSGAWSGGGVLNLIVNFVRGDFAADMSGFTGRVNVTAPTGSEFRLSTSYTPSGFPSAAVNLGAGVTMKHTGILSSGQGTSLPIGELSGVAGSGLQGGVTGGRALTYLIGGKGTNSVFAGTISEQSASTLTNFVKTGAGTWTLSGTGSWAGGTEVSQGGLCISGTVTSIGAVKVADGAWLCLQGGTLTTDAVNLSGTAALTGGGMLHADLNVGSSATVTVGSGTLAVTGDVVNDGVMRFTGGGALLCQGGFVNNGILDCLTGAAQLPAGFENNGIVIDRNGLALTSYGKTPGGFSLSLRTYAGHSYQLQATSDPASGWTPVGAAWAGDGSVKTFTDSSATTRRFYRVAVTP